jgi:hypothetical protein
VLKPYWTFSNVQEFPGMNTLTPRYSRVSVKEHDKHTSFISLLNNFGSNSEKKTHRPQTRVSKKAGTVVWLLTWPI